MTTGKCSPHHEEVLELIGVGSHQGAYRDGLLTSVKRFPKSPTPGAKISVTPSFPRTSVALLKLYSILNFGIKSVNLPRGGHVLCIALIRSAAVMPLITSSGAAREIR